jgi:WD40 repeat protein
MASGRALARWQTGHGDLVGLMFAPGGRTLVSTGRDGFIRIWQVDGRLLDEIDTGLAVTSFAPSEDRRQFLLGHLDGSVSLWTVGGERLGAWKLSHRRITAVAVDAAAGARAAGDKGGRVWRWQGGGPPRMLVSPPTYARTLQFHPADDALYGGGWFDLFRWPVDGDGVEIVPTPHLGILSHIEFSADGSYLASISRQTDSAVMLLDPVSGERLAAYRKHALCGQRVALSPDGRRMISNSDDASVRFYELPQSLD